MRVLSCCRSRLTIGLLLSHLFSSHAFILVPKTPIRTKLCAVAVYEGGRTKQLSPLMDWADKVDIKLGGITVEASSEDDGGLGVVSKQDLGGDSILLTVPSDVALFVETSQGSIDDKGVYSVVDRKVLEQLPWFAQFAVYLFKLKMVDSKKDNGIEMKPWLNSLPRKFETPIHWSQGVRDELQYAYLEESVVRQESQWKKIYEGLLKTGNSAIMTMEWSDFLWGCECARSRAFSGTYAGSAFNPYIYAFTLLLVSGYVVFNLGTIDQAANGAAIVFCAQILKDFVLPKLLKVKRYVICPVMDMANHKSLGVSGEVSFEFFGDAYSLVVPKGVSVPKGSELWISYGARTNDELLQYYGFVEPNNPSDVYVMPPLRDWNIAALEKVCGQSIPPGRLQKLERAGLLGGSAIPMTELADAPANVAGGVVISRVGGVDPAVMQALRALFATDSQWEAAGEAIGNFAESLSAGPETERLVRLAAKTALSRELETKPTSIEEDEALLRRMSSAKMIDSSAEDELCIRFRLEKKKLLKETIESLC